MSVSNITASLPDEMIFEVFKNLPPQVLAGRIFLVCKAFNRVALEPSLYQAHVKIIGKAVYESCADASLGLNFDGLPPLDMKTAVAQVLPFFGRLDKEGLEIEDDAGVAILDIPGNVSINKLIAFATQPKEGNRATVEAFPNSELGELVDLQARRIMITRGALKKSGSPVSMRIFDGKHHPKDDLNPNDDLMKKIDCQIPHPLEMCALALMTFVSSSSHLPVRLFEKAHSYCHTMINHGFGRRPDYRLCQLKMRFYPIITGLRFDFIDTLFGTDFEIGTAAVRELPIVRELPKGEK